MRSPVLLFALIALPAFFAGAVARAEAQVQANLRVVSFNVKLDWAIRHGRAEGISKLLAGAQVVGLQETCSDQKGRSFGEYSRLIEASGGATGGGAVHWHFGRSDPGNPMMCARGVAIFSRFPIRAAGRLELPNLRQRRSAIWADLELPEGTLRVYNLHLENRASNPLHSVDARLVQARVVLDHYNDWRRSHPDSPVIILGDFNSLGNLWDFTRRERAIQEMSGELEPSLPSYSPTLVGWPYQVDWIFSRGLEQISSRVIHSALSDHYPILAEYGPRR